MECRKIQKQKKRVTHRRMTVTCVSSCGDNQTMEKTYLKKY